MTGVPGPLCLWWDRLGGELTANPGRTVGQDDAMAERRGSGGPDLTRNARQGVCWAHEVLCRGLSHTGRGGSFDGERHP